MGTACGRAGVLGSALIHTKTGAHREDVAQHAGDRFGSPITRRPDAAALSDGADSPRVSIPVLRMPPRKPQMTRQEERARADCLNLQQLRGKSSSTCYRSRHSVSPLANISICNSYRVNRPVTVTDQDKPIHLKTTSRSVTVAEQNRPQMLQNETVELSAEEQSRSVTTRPHIPRQMLQIETNVPITNPDRQQKGPDVQPSQLERPAPSSTN